MTQKLWKYLNLSFADNEQKGHRICTVSKCKRQYLDIMVGSWNRHNASKDCPSGNSDLSNLGVKFPFEEDDQHYIFCVINLGWFNSKLRTMAFFLLQGHS